MSKFKTMIADLRADLWSASALERRLMLVMAGLVLTLPVFFYAHSLADIAISLTAILFLIVGARNGALAKVSREPWFILGLVLWAYMVIRGIVSGHVEHSGGTALVWVRYIVFAAALKMLLDRSPTLKRLLLGFIIALTVAVALDTLLQAAIGVDILGNRPIGNRLTGPMERPNVGAALVFSGMAALAWLLLRTSAGSEPLRRRGLALAALLTVTLAILLTGERMAALLVLFGLTILVLVVVRPGWRILAGVVIGGGALGTAVAALNPAIVQRHLSILTEAAQGTQSVYIQLPATAWQMFLENPLFGVGVRNFRNACPDLVTPDLVERVCANLHPHHAWAEILAETGLVGTVLFIAFFVVALTPALRRWRTWRDDPLLAGATLSVLLRLWPLAVGHSFFVNRVEVIFWPMLALVIALGRQGSRKPV